MNDDCVAELLSSPNLNPEAAGVTVQVESRLLTLDAAAAAEALPYDQLIKTLAINDRSIQASDIKGELRDLVTGAFGGRTSDGSITLFKSVGIAIEDPAAAELATKNRGGDGTPPLRQNEAIPDDFASDSSRLAGDYRIDGFAVEYQRLDRPHLFLCACVINFDDKGNGRSDRDAGWNIQFFIVVEIQVKSAAGRSIRYQPCPVLTFHACQNNRIKFPDHDDVVQGDSS